MSLKRICHLNLKIYKQLQPFLLILLSLMILMTLLPYGWKFTFQTVIVLWILILSFYDYFKEAEQ